jgi:hypothetical protein
VHAIGIPDYLVCVKDVSELSCVRHTEAFFASCEPGQGGGPKKALQVYYGVEFAASKAANKRQKRDESTRMEPCLAQEFSVEDRNGSDMRMVFQEQRELGANKPSNLCILETFS